MTVGKITALYEDQPACAKAASLKYVDDSNPGFSRYPRGKGFTYQDENGKTINQTAVRKRLKSLAIPPAWRKVWIAPSENAHLLATGLDDKDRKQYIYHPKWIENRRLLNFYRLIDVGHNLSSIRKAIARDLKKEKISKKTVVATALALIDETLIRVGNESYTQQNDTYGLTTLRSKHLKVYGEKITFEFSGKSHQQQLLQLDNERVAQRLKELRNQADERIFSFVEDGEKKVCSADDINEYLHEVSDCHVSAKDFRTWGGTTTAFKFLKKNSAKEEYDPKEITQQAIDRAAERLGNTVSVAKAHYVHPDVVSLWLEDDYQKLLDKSGKYDYQYARMTKDEHQLISLLELLFSKSSLVV